MERTLYEDVAQRTGGDVYVGVVGPVRTGKSTLIKRVMEELVIPHISDPYRKERARDELPQSGSGRTIMTAEPKFVPEEAVEVSPDGTGVLRVRMIDSVGYMVPGAVGATENGEPRMVTTPWADREIPMTQAAELGTRKVMEEHCSIGLVVTTDGTVTDIPREDYREAENGAIRDMKATGKPFVVVINSRDPEGAAAQSLLRELREKWQVGVYAADCQSMDLEGIRQLLRDMLYAFPMQGMDVYLPRWMDGLEPEHPLKTGLYQALLEQAGTVKALTGVDSALARLGELENVTGTQVRRIDLGTGIVSCEIHFPEELYYEILSQKTGMTIGGEAELMELLTDFAAVKASCEKLGAALEESRAAGYGIVTPLRQEMKLDVPELVHKGSTYGVKLRATAPSIHMLRIDLAAEVSPMVGTEQQAKDLLATLMEQYQTDEASLWESNIFGKSVYEMVSQDLSDKLRRMPADVRMKFRSSLSRTVNEGATGMICILF